MSTLAKNAFELDWTIVESILSKLAKSNAIVSMRRAEILYLSQARRVDIIRFRTLSKHVRRFA